VTWRPYLPEPVQDNPYCYGRWGFRSAGGVRLTRDELRQLNDALHTARSLVENFRIPPRQFRQKIRAEGYPGSRVWGCYHRREDAVAVSFAQLGRCKADSIHYYRILLHELLHATGHARRLNRESLVHFDLEDNAWREEGNVLLAEWLLLEAIGLPRRVLVGHVESFAGFPFSQQYAKEAVAWLLG
jgi:hypothetical protein